MARFEFIDVQTTDGVATITLNRPPLNVMHIPMMAEINAALEAVLADRSVAAVLIRATGKAFSAGVDVADHTAERVGEMLAQFHEIFRRLAAGDALTIAAVQGAALGGGCELACFCDVVLACERARFGQPEVQVGAFPPVAACVLPLRIGLGRAVEMVALGATIDAPEALRIGLIQRICPAEAFDACIDEYLGQVRRLSRPVIRLARRATWQAAREQILSHLERAERLYLEELMRLADSHEGLAAFLEKRPPAWKHE
jgi:cyclohexa-1,5-dienecarbonyl-CoA hydratase